MSLIQKILKLLKINKHEEDSLISLLGNLMRLRGGNIYAWELLITYPSVNMAVNLIDGIKLLTKQNNFIGTISLTRSLIETVMAFVYDCTAQKPNDFYKKFVEFGRLMRFDGSKNKWIKMRDDDLINHFESVTKSGVRKTYNNCCDILHFSTSQVKILADGNIDKEKNIAHIKIGVGALNVPKEKYEEIIKFSNNCEEIMKKYLKDMIENKQSNQSTSN